MSLPASPNAFLMRYNEIALKGGNRRLFERRLLSNIRRKLTGLPVAFYEDAGRYALMKKDESAFSPEESAAIRGALSRVFGLESFSPAFALEPDVEQLRAITAAQVKPVLAALAESRGRHASTFRVRSRRSHKKFAYSSKELEIELARVVHEQAPHLTVDLDHADLHVGVEVRHDAAFLYFEEIRGLGGLPVGSSDNVLTLLSGGIDSPVAAWRAMQRGCHADSITFHSFPYTEPQLLDKVADLQKVLDRYSDTPSRLYACNLAEAQKMVRDRCAAPLRTILYRRLMMKVANILAAHIRARALVTGEALAQVASQTLRNMRVIDHASELLVLRPLVCMDKNETIAAARQIGTFEISNIQCADSCTTFAPAKPHTGAALGFVLSQEDRLDMEAALEAVLKETVLIDTQTMEQIPVPGLMKTWERLKAKACVKNFPQDAVAASAEADEDQPSDEDLAAEGEAGSSSPGH